MKYIALFLILLFTSCTTVKQDETKNEINEVKNEMKKIYIADVTKGIGADSIPSVKFHQAMNVVALLSGEYELLPPDKINSIINDFNNEGIEPRAIDIGRKAEADEIMFANLNRLHNMLRVDLTMFSTHKNENIRMGKGYELMNFIDLETNRMLIDPSLVTATQRAFADVMGDSLMFDTLDGRYRVYPAPVIVITGIAFLGMSDTTDWKLFNDRVIASYDATETIFEETRSSNKYVVYDIATRDSIYAMFNLFGIENDMRATNIEIETLRKLEVEYFITGSIEFLKDSADIRLILYRITNSGQEIVKDVNGSITEDATKALRLELKRLVKQLLAD